MPEMQPEEELRARLALWRAPGIGPATFSLLMERFGCATGAFAECSRVTGGRLDEGLARSLNSPDWEGAERDLAWRQQASNRHILTLTDADYPSRLREIAAAPPILFVAGRADSLADPQIAVVGSRNPSAGGRQNAALFASGLARCGLVITSGLALGIDAAAHAGALEAHGATIAVAGHGLDRVYPAAHRDLAHRITEHGAWISEFPIGIQARPDHFPRRNRIISGLSLGVLVVEAAEQSGSLITARYALEQGREVFAVPGSIHNPASAGCHRLIRAGAILVESAAQVLEELAPLLGNRCGPSPTGPEKAEVPEDQACRGLLELMGYEARTTDELVEGSGLTAEAVSSMLLTLELGGFVAGDVCGRYTRLGRTR